MKTIKIVLGVLWSKLMSNNGARKSIINLAVLMIGLTHAVLMVAILLGDTHIDGSWTGFAAFWIDFPISIGFLWLSKFVPSWALHVVVGSLWWMLLAWAGIKAFLWLLGRS